MRRELVRFAEWFNHHLNEAHLDDEDTAAVLATVLSKQLEQIRDFKGAPDTAAFVRDFMMVITKRSPFIEVSILSTGDAK